MTIKSVNAPAISQAGLERLYAFARPTRLDNTSTMFNAGYEQAKADLLEKLKAEANIPGAEPEHPNNVARQRAMDANLRKQEPERGKLASWLWR